jgi:predicted TIM-barrel fold metal-dependent hydrolase
MDRAGIDRICLFAPYGGESDEAQRASTDFMAKVAKADPERIIGFAWIEPRLSGAPDETQRAIADCGLKGVKMIPHHWYPYDEAIFPVYEKVQELGVPIIFHAGILFGFMDSSRFCRPVHFEALLHFPGIKFALAHIGWPWTDECIATAGRFRAALRRRETTQHQMYIDITRGTPPAWRADALRKALEYLGDDLLIYGSDCSRPTEPQALLEKLNADLKLFSEELHLSAATQEKILSRNLMKLFQR